MVNVRGLVAGLAMGIALGACAQGALPLTYTVTGAQAELAFDARPTARALYFAWGDADAGGRTNGWTHVEKLADVASGSVSASAALPGAFNAGTQKGRFFLYDVYTLASYVQDGLVVQYDAIDNAGTGVHNPSATVWKDLKGTNDIALAGLAFDGNRVLFPVAGRATFDLPMLDTYGDLTLETIAGTDNTFTREGGRIDFVNVGYDLCLAFRYDCCFFMAIFAHPDDPNASSRKAGYYYSDSLGPGCLPGSTFADVKDLHHYAAVLHDAENNGGTLRYDGTYVYGTSTTPSWTSTSFTKHGTKLGIGLNASGRSIFSCLRLYDRALTNEEQEHNWAVDRTRYQGAEPRHLVSPLVGIGAGANARAFRYATWNIGHFACGTNNVSPITSATEPAMRTAYGDFLDGIDAEWFGVNEYSVGFTRDGSVDAGEAVFGRYPVQVVGPKKGYQWNAAFAANRFTVFETVTNFYGYHKQNVYYVANRVLVDDAYEAWFVQTHHDWESEKHRRLQTCQMIHDFADKPRVVISGDFNIATTLGDGATRTTEWATLGYFQNAGYHTVNTGSLGASMVSGRVVIDHIHARGFLIDDGAVFNATGLSDHNAVACRLTPTLVSIEGKTPVCVPANPPDQYYTGEARTPVVTTDPAYTVSWSGERIAVGTYTGTATLVDPSTTCWADGTIGAKTLTFRVLKNVNWWTKTPSLSATNWTSGAAATLNVGTPAFGTSRANYTADMLGELTAGSYVLRLTVTGTENHAGLTYEIPFTVRAALQATVGLEPNGDGVREAALTFAPAEVARTVTLVYDDADAGATDAGWSHRVMLGTVPAGATSATFALPEEVGTRFFAARLFLTTAGYDSTAYVQNGLVVQYDALENAGRGLYCATNAVWKDLVGSRDISAANYDFRGNVAYLPNGKKTSVDIGTTCPGNATKSLELVCHTDDSFDDAGTGRFDVGNIGNDGVIAFRGSGGYYILGLFVIHATRTAYYTDNTSSPFARERQLHELTAYSGVFAPDATNSSLRVNGTAFTTGLTTASGGKNYYHNTSSGFSHNNNLMIPNNSRANMYYASVRLYSRALTDAERAQNYEVDRMRFLGGDPLREATPALTVPNVFAATIDRRAATADVMFTATNFVRRLCVAWGGGDRGAAATNAWPNVVDLAEVPAGTSRLADVALPRAALASTGVRFFLVDVYDSTSYVAEGLKIHWDALENAGRGQYNASATVWKNLAVNTNHLNVKTGTFAANHLFLPKKVCPSVTTDAALFPRTLSKTVESVVWMDDATFDFSVSSRVDLIGVCNDAIIITRGPADTFTGAIFVGQDGTAYYMRGNDLTRNSQTFLAAPQTYSLVNRSSAAESSLRVNGAPYITGNATTSGTAGCTRFHSTPFDHTKDVRIGNDRGTAKIGVVRVYNRTLSDAERDRNARIDLVRYCGHDAPVQASAYQRFANGTAVTVR